MQDPIDKGSCDAVTRALWIWALAKAGGDRRGFVWETYPMRFVPAAKA
jgi:hypothetical protein